MGLTAGANILVAETVQEFAEYVLRLQTDPELWERLSANVWRFAEQTLAVANSASSFRPSLAAGRSRRGACNVRRQP